MNFIISIASFIDRAFAKLVEALLIVILIAMTGLVVGQVLLRNLFASGIAWGDIASRHMVLWVGFLGAMLATRSRKHLAIDALTRMLPRQSRNAVRIFLDALACAVSLLLAKAALDFVIGEKAMGTMLFGDVPTWYAVAIIPFGFAMIGIEYAIGIGLDIWRIVQAGDDEHEAGKGRA